MRHKAHDNARIPIQWDSSPNAGFCPADVKPWMRVNDDHRTANAAEQLARPSSVLSHGRVFTNFESSTKTFSCTGTSSYRIPIIRRCIRTADSQITRRGFWCWIFRDNRWIGIYCQRPSSRIGLQETKVGKPEHDPRGRHPHALLGLQDGKDAHFRM